jgi:hypothetical protein
MALLVDIRNLKRIKRLQVEKRYFADLTILFIRNNEYKKNKTRFVVTNDSRVYSSKSEMIRGYDSINLRLGDFLLSFNIQRSHKIEKDERRQPKEKIARNPFSLIKSYNSSRNVITL